MADIFRLLTSTSRFKKPPLNPAPPSGPPSVPNRASSSSTPIPPAPVRPRLNKTKKTKRKERSMSETSWDGDNVQLTSETSPIRAAQNAKGAKSAQGSSNENRSPSVASLLPATIVEGVSFQAQWQTGQSVTDQTHREEMSAFRRRLKIHVGDSSNVPDPITSFELLKFPTTSDPSLASRQASFKAALLGNLETGSWVEPTPIQMQSLPALLLSRDVIGCAPTGSGKSGSFIIPALVWSLMDENKTSVKGSMRGLIKTLLLTPTRELATQIHREVNRLGKSKPGGLTNVLLSKSNASQAASNMLGGDNGVDVLVSTPMRLCAVMNNHDSRINLSQVRMVALDEADRLLDGGDTRGDHDGSNRGNNDQDGNDSDDEADSFKQTASSFVSQIDQIISATPTTAIRALFSATMGPAVRELASTVLRNPVSITHGNNNSAAGANEDIEQSLLFVGKEEGKLLAIRQIVQKGLKPPVLIFLQSKERAQALFNELLYDGINVDVIHAGRSQAARDNAVTRFRTGETWVLIATDVIARGLDFKAVNLVINYDFPNSGVSYVHRIGRTGRNGRKGKAVTFFTENDFPALRSIANIMKLSGCDVPEWQLKMRKETHAEKKEREKYGVKRDDRGVNTESKYDRQKREKRKRFKQNGKK